MSSDDYVQVGTLIRRLQNIGSLLNPLNVVDHVRTLIGVLSPPPGNPESLDSMARAYTAAANAIKPIGADVAKLGTSKLPEAWKGGAAQEATKVIAATAHAVDRTVPAFTTASTALTTLATSIRDQQKKYKDLIKELGDAAHDATSIGGLPIPDPVGMGKLVGKVGTVINGLIEVYTASLNAADAAAASFADVKGQALAAAAVKGGLAADDAVVLADMKIKTLNGDGFDDGLLNTAQLKRAGEKLAALSPEDRAKFQGLLDNAKTDTQRAWLMKALAAGHGVDKLGPFADKIRDKDDKWLDEHLSLIDRGGTGEQYRGNTTLVEQLDPTTCGSTALIMAKAENDPLYALGLTEGDFHKNFEAEQKKVHDNTNTLWPEAAGTSPWGMTDWMNKNAGNGVEYEYRWADDTNQRDISPTMRDVSSAVDNGHQVPLLVGDNEPRHYVLAVGHSGDQIMIYDPSSGETKPIPRSDFLDGKLGDNTGGFKHVQGAVLPKG